MPSVATNGVVQTTERALKCFTRRIRLQLHQHEESTSMTAEVLIGCLDAIKEMKSNQSLCIKLKRRCWSLKNYS